MERKGQAKTELDALLDKLEFSVEDVIDSAVDQARLFGQAASYRVTCLRRMMNAEMALGIAQSESEQKIRMAAVINDDKITEGNIKSRVLLDQKVLTAARAFNDAKAEEEYSKLLVEAFRHRRDMLRTIGELTMSERSMEGAMEKARQQMATTREKLRNRWGS